MGIGTSKDAVPTNAIINTRPNNAIINTRPDWTEYFKEIVQVTKKRSPCPSPTGRVSISER